jgi:hypothetical protein
MTDFWFTARTKFGPEQGESWQQYIQWAGLPQLTGLFSLDISLCPEVIDQLISEDWQHNVQQDYRLFYFRDLDYLLGRVGGLDKPANLLAVIWEPGEDCRHVLTDPRFQFQGYDLIEETTGISALSNCGGFPLAFRNEDLSPVGLLVDYALARGVQQRLRQFYPEEHHAQCDLWAVWRMR